MSTRNITWSLSTYLPIVEPTDLSKPISNLVGLFFFANFYNVHESTNVWLNLTTILDWCCWFVQSSSQLHSPIQMVVAQYKTLGTQSHNNFLLCLSLRSAVETRSSIFSSNFLNSFLHSLQHGCPIHFWTLKT